MVNGGAAYRSEGAFLALAYSSKFCSYFLRKGPQAGSPCYLCISGTKMVPPFLPLILAFSLFPILFDYQDFDHGNANVAKTLLHKAPDNETVISFAVNPAERVGYHLEVPRWVHSLH